MVLERIYEVDFLDTSYGFRPERSCHQALSKLGKLIALKKVNWISDSDVKGFFDHVSHSALLELLKRRIDDPRMLSLIECFLNAGVMIEGQRSDTNAGVPQGSCLSPLLANVYLHYVLQHQRQLALAGEVPRSGTSARSALDPSSQSQGCIIQLGEVPNLPGTSSAGSSRTDHGLDCHESLTLRHW